MVTTSYLVQGMTCAHCVRSVEAEVGTVPGVSEAHADLKSGALTVTTEEQPDRTAVETAVREAGYEVVP